MDKDKFYKVSYAVGHLFTTIATFCLIAVTLSLTAKFVLWLFGIL